ncbi:hypothetical protein [Nodosilinea sp. E11]|uniref:hypothetical protein n=1 Tax=Nodosilinea sp. E11 TaxID=3037479 RepID=UPI00293420D3|nr:hypothetical protein [Nodosilinea sp. E11]WOD37888.1 hypothetical protein RRF56_16880 [Nodosilinea sp. E11]
MAESEGDTKSESHNPDTQPVNLYGANPRAQVEVMMTRFLQVFLTTLLMLVLLFVALPALLTLMDVDSFRIGDGVLLVLDWRNHPNGNRIMFGVLPLGLGATVVALIDQWVGDRDRL